MNRNTAMVGEFTLTVSLSSLYEADKALLAAGKPMVMETFIKILPAATGAAFDISTLDISGLDFESFAIVFTAFLKPVHNLTLKKALDGPLNEGTPIDWIGTLFGLLMGAAPQEGDKEPDDADNDGKGEAGNVLAA